MATGKSKPPSRKDTKPSAAAKPRAIIEGSATDVTPKAAKDRTGAKKPAPEPAREAKPETTSKNVNDAVPAGRSRSQPVATLVAAGLIGGATALVLMALAISFDGPPRAWLARATGAAEATRMAVTATQIARKSAEDLEKSVAGQQSQLKAVRSRLAEVAEMSGKLPGITARLEGLGEIPAQTTALALRLEAAETRLDTLAASAATRGQTVDSLARALDSAAKAGTSAAAVSAGLELAILRLDDAEVQLSRLDQAIEAMSQTTPPDAGRRQDIETRLATLSQAVDALADRMSSQRAGALAVGFERLKSAIAAGQPYAVLLTPFAQNPAAAGLAEFADTGAPTITNLQEELSKLQDQTPGTVEIEGTLGRITSLLGDAIKVRRTKDTAAADDPIAAAQIALEAGNLNQAADRIAAVGGPDAEAWVTAARARVQIDTALAVLETSILSPPPDSRE